MSVQRQVMGNVAKPPVAKVHDTTVQGAAGPLPARVCDPHVGIATSSPAPMILYFHGGDWVTGDLDSYDASDRVLAAGTGAIVVLVQYRLAPKARFPAAQDDADKSYNWLLSHTTGLGGDPTRIAFAGESAGGNLAIDTDLWARGMHLPVAVAVAELLVYPVVGTDLTTPSYNQIVDAVPLNRSAIEWYVAHTTAGAADLADKRLVVLGKPDLHGLPPTTILSAQIDPLRSEGEMLAVKLWDAGVDVQQQMYPGVTHEFFGMGSIVGQAKLAENFTNTSLSVALVQPVAAPMVAPMHGRHRMQAPHKMSD